VRAATHTCVLHDHTHCSTCSTCRPRRDWPAQISVSDPPPTSTTTGCNTSNTEEETVSRRYLPQVTQVTQVTQVKMGCFTFVKLMMVVFNLLIFVSKLLLRSCVQLWRCTCTAHQYYITAVNTGRGLSDHGDFNSESLRHTSRSLDNDLDLVQVHMRGQ
ncbi:hypothetical protein INR49_008832, partial [Caranx melampygus]